MTVSALIPSYNRRKYVLRAIESVLSQTVPVDQIIVVDDGSTDGTVGAIRRSYGPRITLITQANMGASAARARGIREATGEWIGFLDSDDIWLPTKIERQFEALAGREKDFGACFTDCQFTDRPQTAFESAGLKKHGSFGVLDNPLPYLLARHPVVFIPSLLVRKSLAEQVGGFDGAMIVAEDTDFLFRLALRTNFCFVSEPHIKIDCTTPARLTQLYDQRNDKAFCSKEYMYRKWLSLPELTDPDVRALIRTCLLDSYNNWAICKLHQFRFFEAAAKMREARKMGDNYLCILSKLVFRAGRKIVRTVAVAVAG
jgi:glycosyltransferase involved in cell wall biosynthesis